jgi:hypothetical protein
MNIDMNGKFWKFILRWTNYSNDRVRLEEGNSDLCAVTRMFIVACIKSFTLLTVLTTIGLGMLLHLVGFFFIGNVFSYSLGESSHISTYVFGAIAIFGTFGYMIAAAIICASFIEALDMYIIRSFFDKRRSINKSPSFISEAVKGYFGKYCVMVKLVQNN